MNARELALMVLCGCFMAVGMVWLIVAFALLGELARAGG